MTGRRRSPRPASSRQAPRTARLNELLREVVGEELTRIADERLELVSVTAIDVDNDLNRAIVYFDSLAGEPGDAEVLEALGQHRRRLQSAIGRQIHARKTPVLDFRPDEVIRSAQRIEQILRDNPPVGTDDPAPDASVADAPLAGDDDRPT
jgi:ribosome-binding factor A